MFSFGLQLFCIKIDFNAVPYSSSVPIHIYIDMYIYIYMYMWFFLTWKLTASSIWTNNALCMAAGSTCALYWKHFADEFWFFQTLSEWISGTCWTPNAEHWILNAECCIWMAARCECVAFIQDSVCWNMNLQLISADAEQWPATNGNSQQQQQKQYVCAARSRDEQWWTV